LLLLLSPGPFFGSIRLDTPDIEHDASGSLRLISRISQFGAQFSPVRPRGINP
jgi:hypothetical protein